VEADNTFCEPHRSLPYMSLPSMQHSRVPRATGEITFPSSSSSDCRPPKRNRRRTRRGFGSRWRGQPQGKGHQIPLHSRTNSRHCFRISLPARTSPQRYDSRRTHRPLRRLKRPWVHLFISREHRFRARGTSTLPHLSIASIHPVPHSSLFLPPMPPCSFAPRNPPFLTLETRRAFQLRGQCREWSSDESFWDHFTKKFASWK
jgi:hypothetical protein